MSILNTRSSESEKETQRIEAFSDGVFAIVVTLLVLELHIPTPEQSAEHGLWSEMLALWPNMLAFAASFFFVLVMWINHHRLFTAIRRTDNNLLLLNGLLLFGVTLVPFPTALVAEYIQHSEQTTAVLIYNGWFLVVAIFFQLLWGYAARGNRLFSEKTDPELSRSITRQYAFGPFLYLTILLLAFVSPLLSLLGNVALAVFFALPNKTVQKLIDAQS
jgi:uncharacterized membrane protein